MRKTVKVSVWPVAFAGGLKYEGPECGNGVVTKWHVSWGATRYACMCACMYVCVGVHVCVFVHSSIIHVCVFMYI